jgi:hypothetical protein
MFYAFVQWHALAASRKGRRKVVDEKVQLIHADE